MTKECFSGSIKKYAFQTQSQ